MSRDRFYCGSLSFKYYLDNQGIYIGRELFVRAEWTITGLEDSLRYYISDCDVAVSKIIELTHDLPIKHKRLVLTGASLMAHFNRGRKNKRFRLYKRTIF